MENAMNYGSVMGLKTTQTMSRVAGDATRHLVLDFPVVLLAAFAVVLVHLHSVLPHQQQVLHEGLEVHLAQGNALQFAASYTATPTKIRKYPKYEIEDAGEKLQKKLLKFPLKCFYKVPVANNKFQLESLSHMTQKACFHQ